MTTNTTPSGADALREYANPLNWDVDVNGIRRVWLEPGSTTTDAYNGFELARAALSAAEAQAARKLSADELDAKRYRTLRSRQKWSVINGIGDSLRAEELDAAIDAAMKEDSHG